MRGASFLASIAASLGIPLGSKRRPADGSTTNDPLYQNDFVNSILDISRDDVCIGETPLFYKSTFKRLPRSFKLKIDELTKELNTIMAWVALDILKTGTSLYYIDLTDDNKVRFVPFLPSHDVYLTRDKKIIIISDNKRVDDLLIFLFYEKDMLEPVKLKDMPDVLFKVRTVGLSLKNAKSAITDLLYTERFIARARAQMRLVRIANVEVGIAKSDRQTEIVDDISEGLNANSIDMPQDPTFDDQIPVFPSAKGVGAVKFETDVPNFDLGQLSDLDYNLSKAFLALRFPKTYADFSTNLTPTAVSLIRGDIRYAKLIGKARSIIETTINSWVSTVPTLVDRNIKFYLTALPTPEADDVTTTLDAFTDFTEKAINMIFTNTTTKDVAHAKLNSLTALFSQQTNIKSVERWADSMREIIEKTFEPEGGAPPPDGEDLPPGGDLDTGEGSPTGEGVDQEEVVSKGGEDLNTLNTPPLDNVGI